MYLFDDLHYNMGKSYLQPNNYNVIDELIEISIMQ